jgi:hypothetical protein
MNESGLTLQERPKKNRPVMYNLDPDMNIPQQNIHIPKVVKLPQGNSSDKMLVSALFGAGAGMIASALGATLMPVVAVSIAVSLLIWECVEIER